MAVWTDPLVCSSIGRRNHSKRDLKKKFSGTTNFRYNFVFIQDLIAMQKDEAKNQKVHQQQINQPDAYEEKAEPMETEEDVDDEHQLVNGVFAARERVKQGDFDFAEHPLERRANAAMHNGCKVLLLCFLNGGFGKGRQM